MTLQELIKALNVTDEEAATTAIKNYLDGQYVTKARFNEVNESKKSLETQLTERDNQLKELKKVDADALKDKIKELEEANKAAKAQAVEQLNQLKIDSAIKIAIGDKTHDADMVASLFDKSKLILGEDGKITGLDEQLNQLKADKAFLFKQVEKPKPYDPVAGTDPAVNNPFAKDTWNMTEQGKMLRENPEQAARLKAAANGK